MADVCLKPLTYVGPATMAEVNPVTAANASLITVAVQSHESWCQEPVLWQAEGLAFDTVINLTHMVVLTMSHFYREPSLGDVVSKCHILIASPTNCPCWPMGSGIFMRRQRDPRGRLWVISADAAGTSLSHTLRQVAPCL